MHFKLSSSVDRAKKRSWYRLPTVCQKIQSHGWWLVSRYNTHKYPTTRLIWLWKQSIWVERYLLWHPSNRLGWLSSLWWLGMTCSCASQFRATVPAIAIPSASLPYCRSPIVISVVSVSLVMFFLGSWFLLLWLEIIKCHNCAITRLNQRCKVRRGCLRTTLTLDILNL